MSICKRRKVCPLGADARPCCLEPTIGRKFGDLADDNWTCKRALDGALVQKDFVLSDSRLFVDNVWNDDVVAVGVDHRCVHCVLTRNKSLKSWVPFLDATGEPSLYRNVLDTQLALVDNPSCGEIENALLVAGNLRGKPSRRRIKFKPSRHLQSLRQQRRQTQLHEERKIFTFQIQKLHRSEVRRWKTQVCSNLLRSTTNWATLKRVSQQGRAQTKGADVAVDDFAENLETLFHGDADQPVRPHTPTELPWSTFELRAALQKLRRNKSPDEHGLSQYFVSFFFVFFFFSPRLFDRRRFSNKNCFTDLSPGMWARTMLVIFIRAAPGCA